jgi:threonine dehydrogenase-like Zn-dependent dehydrogenase
VRALVVPAPGVAEVQDVEPPAASPGDVLVAVERVGICGTDVELFGGTMAYLHQGHTHFPLRLGHEWCGTVIAAGDGVPRSWVGRRVTGDTMLSCGQCRRCLKGLHHVCGNRGELGVRDGRPGALAEQLAVPATSLRALPDTMDPAVGAMVEPGGNALRAAEATALAPGERALVMGPGTIGLLTAMFLRADGADVHLLGETSASVAFGRTLGFDQAWTTADLPDVPFDAVVDASNAASLPGRAVELVEPGRRVVYIGLAGEPSRIDTRALALKDVTAVGILGGSLGLSRTVERYASGAVDPTPLIAATVGLSGTAAILSGERPDGAGPGPKLHVDPRM